MDILPRYVAAGAGVCVVVAFVWKAGDESSHVVLGVDVGDLVDG